MSHTLGDVVCITAATSPCDSTNVKLDVEIENTKGSVDPSGTNDAPNNINHKHIPYTSKKKKKEKRKRNKKKIKQNK
jgi:hypothetical protein